MLSPKIYVGMTSATSSQESEFGLTPCEKQDGMTTSPSGQDPVPASLSAQSGAERDSKTAATCGLTSISSLTSADLATSLANKFQARTGSLGSILYRIIWKVRTTPSGRLIYAQRASVLRTSVKGYTGQQFSGWVTPTQRDYRDTPGMSLVSRKGRPRVDLLPRQAYLVEERRWERNGGVVIGSGAKMDIGDPLNPALARWLMGLPPEWDACADMAMRSLRR